MLEEMEYIISEAYILMTITTGVSMRMNRDLIQEKSSGSGFITVHLKGYLLNVREKNAEKH